jgi:nucleoside-diphosphate-sugar epimerase
VSRVVVTGGAGRLGRSVVESLAAAGHAVISIDQQTAGLPAREIVHDLADLDGTTALFEELAPDAVIHLAAISVPFSLPDPVTFAINTSLAYSVLEASLSAGAGAILMTSSPTVIGYNSPSGWAPAYLPLDEEHPVAPWNGYALSKQSIEELVAMAVRRYGDRARFGVFRPCFVIAPEEWRGAPTQQGHTVAERLDDPALSAVSLFNYLDARDAGEFVLRWLERAADIDNGTCFFVGAPDSLLREPTAPALERLVPEVGAAAAALSGDAAVFSSARAEKLLGWRPVHTWRTAIAAATTSGSGIDPLPVGARADAADDENEE